MRNGKIARLPVEIVEELNRRMERGEAGVTILVWLNGLEDVRKVLNEKFGGAPVTKQNLSGWRSRGFREWQAREEIITPALRNAGREVEADLPSLMARLLSMMAGHYARLLASREGKPNADFQGRVRVLRGLLKDFALLQRAVGRR